jgi:hypothetical protein
MCSVKQILVDDPAMCIDLPQLISGFLFRTPHGRPFPPAGKRRKLLSSDPPLAVPLPRHGYR